MQVKKFQKNKEDFICEKCGTEVNGNGFTNHCPECLWSKHVDIFPGDRLEDCGGLMKPIDIIPKGDTFLLIHKCEKCGSEFKVKLSDNDSKDSIFKLNERLAEEKFDKLIKG